MENTVIILGAGSSKTYGFPTGNELLENIITLGHPPNNTWCSYEIQDRIC